MICITCKTNAVPKERDRWICDECLHAEVTRKVGAPAVEPVSRRHSGDLSIRDVAPVLRNARRRLLHGMSPEVLHAVQQATCGSEALFAAAIELIYVEAKLTGGFVPLEDGTTVPQKTAMFLGWCNLTGASAQAGVLQRCVDRIEAELRI